MNSQPVSPSTSALWSGRIVSAIPAVVLLLTGTLKLFHPPMLEEGFRRFGIPQEQMFGIGLLEIVCTILYAVPITSVLGAVLLPGYLGGAIMTGLRVGDSWVLPLMIGVFLWGGLWLRNPRVLSLLPLVRDDDSGGRND
jgi:DoxX-like family